MSYVRKRASAHVTAEQLRALLHYDTDTGVFRWARRVGKNSAGTVAGSPQGRDGRWRSIMIQGKNYLAHRLAWIYVHGSLPSAMIDHIDRDPANNRIANLRECTNFENHQNKDMATNGRSFGYCKVNNRFRSSINVHGKKIHLGYFDTAGEAAAAYLKAKPIYHPFYSGQPPSIREREEA